MILKYKSIFSKGPIPNWSEEVFIVKKVVNTVLLAYLISDFNGQEIVGALYKKELQKTNRTEFRIEK